MRRRQTGYGLKVEPIGYVEYIRLKEMKRMCFNNWKSGCNVLTNKIKMEWNRHRTVRNVVLAS